MQRGARGRARSRARRIARARRDGRSRAAGPFVGRGAGSSGDRVSFRRPAGTSEIGDGGASGSRSGTSASGSSGGEETSSSGFVSQSCSLGDCSLAASSSAARRDRCRRRQRREARRDPGAAHTGRSGRDPRTAQPRRLPPARRIVGASSDRVRIGSSCRKRDLLLPDGRRAGVALGRGLVGLAPERDLLLPDRGVLLVAHLRRP